MSGGTGTILRNAAWNTLDEVAGFATSIVTSIAVARCLGPTKLGYYNYILWLATMSAYIVTLGVSGAARKFSSELMGKGDVATARTVLRVTATVQSVFSLVVTAGGMIAVAALVEPSKRSWAWIAVASIFPLMMVSVPSAAIVATQDLKANVVASIVATLTNLVGVVVSLVLEWDLVGLASSLLLSRIIDVSLRAVLARRVWQKLPPSRAPLEPELKKRMLRFCVQSTGVLVVNLFVWQRAEMFFLERQSTIEQVAYYSLGFNLTSQLLIVPRLLSLSTEPVLLVEQGRDPSAAGRLATGLLKVVCTVAFPLSFGLAALAQPLVHVMYGEQYASAVSALCILAIAGAARAVTVPAELLLTASDRQSTILKNGVVVAIMVVAGNLVLAPMMGATGAAIVRGCAFLIAAAAFWVDAVRNLNVSLPWLRLGTLLGSSIVMGILVWVVTLTLSPILGLVIGCPLGAVLFMLMLKLTRSVEPSDHALLMRVGGKLPGPVRRFYVGAIDFVVHRPLEQAS